MHRLFPTAVGEFHCAYHYENKKCFYEAFSDHHTILEDGSIFTGESSGFIYLHNDERLSSLFSFAASCVEKYMQQLMMKTELFSIAIVKSWVSHTTNDFYIPNHIHATSHFSFVYYVEVPHNSNALTFCINASPNEPFPTAFSSDWNKDGLIKNIVTDYVDINSKQWTFPVEEGRLFVFPSNLPHQTSKFGDMPQGSSRISVAGDVLLVYKEPRPNYPTGVFDPNNWKYF